ncbi:BED FINGER-RELATED [Plasmopara halstedii]|uniref:BED FINGER-RELATED n=1 Tax=Plasmopara halstedii TaxID=4781 RepID=A0A0P1B313_PLAHL|nr:BED FINGER-RELATED [Plasmopara halstedii]CEG48209.1 BED FINGER-RELATED [Plasmopara halstedii]|eukprot:XP_024584578.1 BED FINGER-RELATED [Plasmopara halstedii]
MPPPTRPQTARTTRTGTPTARRKRPAPTLRPGTAADNAGEEDDTPVLSYPAQDENNGGSQPDDMVGEEDKNSVALTSKKALELLEKDGLLTPAPPTTFTSPAWKEFMILTDLFGDETAFCVCNTNRKRQRTLDEFSTVAPNRPTKHRVAEGCVRVCVNDGRPCQSFASESMKALFEILLDIGKRSKARLILGGQYGLLPHPMTLSRNIVKIHKLAQLDLAALLRTLLLVPNDSMAGALTADLWEEKYSRLHYLGLTVHYVEEFVLKVRRFALLDFDSTATHSASNIENQFCGLFRDRFTIPVADIRAIFTSDSESAMLSCFNGLRCACHRLQTVLKDTFVHKDSGVPAHIRTIFVCASNLVTYFRKCGQAAVLPSIL